MIAGGLAVLFEDYILKKLKSRNPCVADEEEISSAEESVSLIEPEDSHCRDDAIEQSQDGLVISARSGVILIVIFAVGLVAAIVMRNLPQRSAQVFGTFYTVGCLIFGGGPGISNLYLTR
jgi:hypothetical protein